MSNFEYCAVVWHFCGKMNNNKIEKIQKRRLRIVYSDYNATYENLPTRLGTITMLQRRVCKILIEVYKSINEMNPAFLNDTFELKSPKYFMRNFQLLNQPKKTTTTFGLRSFSYFGSKLWNDLPNNIKKSKDIDEFKSHLKLWSKSMHSLTYLGDFL